ncbi:MAG: hypothetical protein LBH76_01380 [Propionibacteriaceae bacterium]|nr:hypothetical protein [Propionibacteriaceae bacterium]
MAKPVTRTLLMVAGALSGYGEDDLRSVGIAAVNPDLFLSIRATPEGYSQAVRFIAARFKNPKRTAEQIHIRLGRAHPLTVAAMAPAFPSARPMAPVHAPPRMLYRGNRCLSCLQIRAVATLGRCPGCAGLNRPDRPGRFPPPR